MVDTTTLGAHDAMPTGRTVVVLRRFEEDAPNKPSIRIVITGRTEESTRPHNPDGTLMDLPQAIKAAKQVARSEGLDRVFVLDRLAGERESDIMEHGGDHSVHMQFLSDTDEEDGVRGSDLRDVSRRTPAAEPG